MRKRRALLAWLSPTLLIIGACTQDSSENGAVPQPMPEFRVSNETERLYQEREALIYGIETLDREAGDVQRLRDNQ